MKITQTLLSISVVFLLFSCATELPPTGGTKDVDAPTFLSKKSFPDSSNRTNFTSNKIILTFDEPIDVHNFAQNFQSNPQLNSIPKYSVKKNQLQLTLQDTLQKNTTYIFTLNNCIQDITEKNKIDDFSFAFSTGNLMDSLSIKGKLLNEYTNRPGSNYIVGLYESSDTLSPFKHSPIYSTKADKDGNFSFDYLKKSDYTLIAFEKPTSGNIAKYPSSLAFTNIKLDSNIVIDEPLTISKQSDYTLFIKTLSQKDGYVRTKLNKEIISPTNLLFTQIEDQYNFFPELNDSSNFTITLKDEYGNHIDSTITHEMLNDTVSNNITTSFTQVDNYLQLIITSEYPIQYNTDTLQYIVNNKDTLTIEITQDHIFLKDTINIKNRNYTSIKLLSDSNCYKSSYTIDYQYINKNTNLLSAETSSILKGKIVSSESNFIFELIDSKQQVVRTLINKTDINFTFLKPDIYTYRIILDEDANKRYSEGDYFSNKKAERVIFSEKQIILKANWEVDNINITIP